MPVCGSTSDLLAVSAHGAMYDGCGMKICVRVGGKGRVLDLCVFASSDDGRIDCLSGVSTDVLPDADERISYELFLGSYLLYAGDELLDVIYSIQFSVLSAA